MKRDFAEIAASKAWPCVEAKRIYDAIGGRVPEKGYVLFETGYGPSGLPHIGTFAEVSRTIMVKKAFEALCDIPTKLICFSDDMDGLRKIPENLPNQEMLKQHLGKPLSMIPDPYEEKESFGAYMNAKLCSFLDRFNFEYEFYSATKCYKGGVFDQILLQVAEKYEQLMQLMLPTLRAERQKTYSPFMPICPKTGIVLQVKTEQVNAQEQTISYFDQQGELITVPIIGGHCKLQWKPDFGMRWAALDVDYEMYGKDHRPNAELYSKICQLLDGKPPVQFFYELFLDEDGSKISKSKGNSISVDQWLHYAPLESMSLFMYQSPAKAKRLHFDVLPKNVDEYISFNQKYHAENDLQKKLANPVYHIHHGQVPIVKTYGISFSLLLNLTSVCNPENKEVLWAFISKYAPEATPQEALYLDKMTEYAINYYNDFVKNQKSYLKPNEQQKQLLAKIIAVLEQLTEEETSEQIQTKIYAIGMESGYDNLRDFFKDIYQIILGQEQGPRLGSFFKLYGLKPSIELIKSKITI